MTTHYTSTIVVPNERLADASGQRLAELHAIEQAMIGRPIVVERQELFAEWSTRFTFTGPADDVRPISTRLMTWLLKDDTGKGTL